MSNIETPPDKEIAPDNFDSPVMSENEKYQGGRDIENNGAESISFDLAGLDSRALAFFIDLILISVVALLAFGAGTSFLNDSNIESFDLKRVFIPIYLLLFFLGSAYFVILHGYGGKTIGKMLLGIRLVTEQGNNVGFWEAFVRWVGYYISTAFLFIGFIWSIFDSRSQSWHDKIAGTFVVKD
jgi:uncharacterized RDD family membrane protein YckC